MTGRPTGSRPTSAPVHRAEQLDASWRLRAACRPQPGLDPGIFFPTQGQSQAQAAAKAVCAGCPVQAPCLEYAMVSGIDDGVWGGLDEDERRKLRKNLHRCALNGCTRIYERLHVLQRYCCDAHAKEGRRESKTAWLHNRKRAEREEREREAG